MGNEPHKVSSAVSDESRKDPGSEVLDAHVGLFYVIAWKLYWEGIPAEQADGAYFKSYQKTFYTYWKNTVTRNHPELQDYDFRRFPRGRAVFDAHKDSYVILADKCIVENPNLIKKIISEMRLPEDKVTASVDKDYECSECQKAAVKAAHPDYNDPDAYFKTTRDGRKVFLPRVFRGDRGYIIPSDEEYKRLRRVLKYWLILTPFVGLTIFSFIKEITDSHWVIIITMLSMVLVLLCQCAWIRKKVRGYVQTDEKQ